MYIETVANVRRCLQIRHFVTPPLLQFVQLVLPVNVPFWWPPTADPQPDGVKELRSQREGTIS